MPGGKKIIFWGQHDRCGAQFLAGQGRKPRFGNGYVRRSADVLCGEDVDICNAGHDGFTVQWLLRMLEWDFLRHFPDMVYKCESKTESLKSILTDSDCFVCE